ncbi:hypothetical protein WN48_09919 [Eufriesea mexicana]|uniref:Uncharacterized protein n=1 Tax=Eufriesea mexicana TaxID=516756 RepID=A0A310SMW1_9HYME|nr:hypothetical protein WN48_09919 [Eufriesea mexicana]
MATLTGLTTGHGSLECFRSLQTTFTRIRVFSKTAAVTPPSRKCAVKFVGCRC